MGVVNKTKKAGTWVTKIQWGKEHRMLLLHPTARRRVDMRAGPVRGLQCAAWFDLCEPGLGLTIRPGLEMDYGKYNNFCGILKTKKWDQITDYVTKPSQIGNGGPRRRD